MRQEHPPEEAEALRYEASQIDTIGSQLRN